MKSVQGDSGHERSDNVLPTQEETVCESYRSYGEEEGRCLS